MNKSCENNEKKIFKKRDSLDTKTDTFFVPKIPNGSLLKY